MSSTVLFVFVSISQVKSKEVVFTAEFWMLNEIVAEYGCSRKLSSFN